MSRRPYGWSNRSRERALAKVALVLISELSDDSTFRNIEAKLQSAIAPDHILVCFRVAVSDQGNGLLFYHSRCRSSRTRGKSPSSVGDHKPTRCLSLGRSEHFV